MSIQHFLVGIFSLLSLTCLVRADDRISLPMFGGGSQITRDNAERIELALRSPTDCRFVDESLEKAITTLGQRHHIETWIDIQALQDEGVASDQQVTLAKSGLSLEATLDLLLQPLGLTFVSEDGVLKITTQTTGCEIMSTRIYPVGDLVGTNYKVLSQLLIDNTSGQWVIIDQEGGIITPFPRSRSIIIRQTYKVHREIEGLLTALRQSKKMQVTSLPIRSSDPHRLNAAEASLKIRPTQRTQQLRPTPVSQPTRMWSAGG
ncbi:MAG: hypothetical protein JWP89_912 [Schlesneria sp.]|nr:hypothetical protein [Schlesneria sp.]